ncbi:acyl-CoA dehydrogenase family member 11-like isoform X3 [Varanus komodoensis]|nr:acyl-CoA dehydrogenase family member 11-like isoform X3 [Varanus komodoensis]XP_044304934.1 acyl-CoA dehydrogenase family member 11-like isoform X3 [Varanus komodoensis]
MKEISAEEGMVAEAYERRYSNWSRIHQIAKLYLYAPSAAIFTCPLAMTDGAAKVIQSLGFPKPLEEAFAHLVSRDPRRFWTSGQWMTERKGGSDVASGTETVAQELHDGTYSLHGLKWFASAIDSDITLTLARIRTADGQIEQGSKGLSLFYLKIRDEEGNLNGIEIQRLKEKLGTRQLPTAELLLAGARAHRISPVGRGVASIAKMLTITRIHNAISAAANMRRMISMARDYATKRRAFGKTLKEYPVHMQTLARMEVEARGAFLLVMEVGRLLGLEETEMATEQDQHMLRLLTSVVKLYTGKQVVFQGRRGFPTWCLPDILGTSHTIDACSVGANSPRSCMLQAVAVASEGLECFGAQGFMEDTGLAVFLRDAQVLPIWEGTTNILSLDVLRTLDKSHGRVLEAFFSTAQAKLEVVLGFPEMGPSVQKVHEALHKLGDFIKEIGLKREAELQLLARDFAYTLARIYGGILLLEHAARPNASPTDISAAQRWCHQDLCPVAQEDQAGSYSAAAVSLDTSLVYDGYPVSGEELN